MSPRQCRRGEGWIDEDPGPLVRPYTMTGGRTRPSSEAFDLIAYVLTVEQAQPEAGLHPEHLAVLDVCRRPLPVAEVAATLDLPLGVVRVLLGDLLDRRLIVVREPATQRSLPDEQLLQAVMNGLQAL